MGVFDEQVRQNMALFDRAMKMFTPFAYPPRETPRPLAPARVAGATDEDTLAKLKKQMADMPGAIGRTLEEVAGARGRLGGRFPITRA